MYPETELTHIWKRLTVAFIDDNRPRSRFNAPEDWRERSLELHRWLDNHGDRLRQIIGNAYLDARRKEPRPWTPEDAALVEASLADLDTTPAGPSARKTFLPMWPMTMAQLRQMATRTNPTPFKRKEKIGRHGFAGLYPHVSERPDLSRIATEQAWKRAAPEGFPPYPRREGLYSRDEQGGIEVWLRDVWEPAQEAKAIAKAADERLVRSGIDGWKVRAMMPQDWSSVMRQKIQELFRTRKNYAHPTVEEDHFAAGHTPKEVLAKVLEWAPGFLDFVDKAKAFSPDILRPKADPDAHMQEIVFPLDKAKIAHNAYGLSDRIENWTEKLSRWGNRRVAPTQLLDEYPLSRLLEEQRKAKMAEDAEVAERERRQAAAKKEAADALQKMVDRGLSFSRPNIQRALPNHRLDVSYGTVRLFDAAGTQAGWGDSKSQLITDSLASLAKNLGVKVP